MSKQGMSSGRPSRCCRRQALVGAEWSGVTVATMQAHRSLGSTFPCSSALRAACSARSDCCSPSQKCRVRMPVRVAIHSSLVSTSLLISSLVTTLAGRARPVDTIFNPFIAPPSGSGACPSLGIFHSAAGRSPPPGPPGPGRGTGPGPPPQRRPGDSHGPLPAAPG